MKNLVLAFLLSIAVIIPANSHPVKGKRPALFLVGKICGRPALIIGINMHTPNYFIVSPGAFHLSKKYQEAGRRILVKTGRIAMVELSKIVGLRCPKIEKI